MKQNIIPILMPKWGLTMEEGQVNEWLVIEGAEISVGDEIIEVETDKISGVVEATDAGLLRRCIAETDTFYPVKSLLGVLADTILNFVLLWLKKTPQPHYYRSRVRPTLV